MFNKSAIWIALVTVPALYALARCTTWPWPLVLSGILHWGLACTILVGTSSYRSGTPDIGLRRRTRGFLIFVGIITVYCSGLIYCFGSQPLADWQLAQNPLGRWGVLVIAITAGFCEEVIYRGYLMTGLKHLGLPAWVAMILSSLSFVLFHGILPIPFMATFFVISMIWAMIYQKTSVLWVTIYIHALWDATVLLIPFGTNAS